MAYAKIEPSANNILLGRNAVDAYRQAHTELHANGWYKGISEAHTPLLEKMLAGLEKEGFTSSHIELKDKSANILSKFFTASETQNIKELGFESKGDFGSKATKADMKALDGKWQ